MGTQDDEEEEVEVGGCSGITSPPSAALIALQTVGHMRGRWRAFGSCLPSLAQENQHDIRRAKVSKLPSLGFTTQSQKLLYSVMVGNAKTHQGDEEVCCEIKPTVAMSTGIGTTKNRIQNKKN